MDLRGAHHIVDGIVVSGNVERIIRAIKDYEPELEVKWIPPRGRTEGQPAFSIEHHPRNQASYVLFYVQSEEEFDERVLLRIIYNDQRKDSKTWDQFSAWEEAQKRIQQQKWEEEMEMMADISYHILKSPLNKYKVNDNLVIKEGIPFNAAKMKD